MDTPLPTHVPALIAACMRGSGTRTGPFTVGLDAHSDDPMRNYAVPDHGARPGAGDIDALITLFRHRHRVPRLEYIEEDAPRAWPALAAAGFTIERRTPVMIATPATTLTPRSPAGITILLATSDTDLARTAHSRGIGLVFLEAEPEEEQIYRRTGSTDSTTKIWASIR